MILHSLRLVWVLLIAVSQLPAASAQILNSERIDQTFGSYGIDVLYSDDRLRLSNLYSLQDGHKVMRTFAIVAYPAVVDPVFAEAHERILAGGSIGATFRDAGWQIAKVHLAFFERRAPRPVARAMSIDAEARLASHAYRLDIVRGDQRFEYATIIEMHHPDYLDHDALIEIYAPGWQPKPGLEAPVQRLLSESRGKLDAVSSALRE